jgi:hypothetical protein
MEISRHGRRFGAVGSGYWQKQLARVSYVIFVQKVLFPISASWTG